MEISSKSSLGVFLSRLRVFESPKSGLEQYPTEAEIAAEIIWNAFFRREIEDKIIADLGCGTGVLGIGAFIMGAKKVFFVDIDEKSLEIAKENIDFAENRLGILMKNRAEFICSDVAELDKRLKVDVVLENPPFGVQKKHADKAFLEKAMQISDIIYSFHKVESKDFIDAVCKKNGFKINGYWEFDFPLKMTMKYHAKKIQRIRVGCWRLERLLKG